MDDAAADKRFSEMAHRRKPNDVPVMFFGTCEVGSIGPPDVCPFQEGVLKGFFNKSKQKGFIRALVQVRRLRLGAAVSSGWRTTTHRLTRLAGASAGEQLPGAGQEAQGA